MHKPDQIRQQLEAIINAEQIQPWEAIDPRLKHQLSRAIAPPHHPACIVYPQTQSELAEMVTCAHRCGWTILPCGSGSKLHWGSLASPIDVVVSTARLTQIIDHAVGDLTVTAEAGLVFSDLQARLAPMNQSLALDPSYAHQATLGGLIATADAGFLRQRYGGVRDMVIGISLVRADGQQAKAGGRVVKNVAGYDLMKLLTGSWGTLGIISQVTLRLYPQPETSQTVVLTGPTSTLQAVAAQLFASSLTPTAFVALSAAVAGELNMNPDLGLDVDQERAIALVVRFQSIAVSTRQQATQLMKWAQEQDLVGQSLEDTSETQLWQQLASQQSRSPKADTDASWVRCKIGVSPARALAVLAQLTRDFPTMKGWVNAGKGIGTLQFNTQDFNCREPSRQEFSTRAVEQMRSLCETHGGFLTLLDAPTDWKQTMDTWGYRGNALPMMKRLKQHFDPTACLSPGRFVCDI